LAWPRRYVLGQLDRLRMFPCLFIFGRRTTGFFSCFFLRATALSPSLKLKTFDSYTGIDSLPLPSTAVGPLHAFVAVESATATGMSSWTARWMDSPAAQLFDPTAIPFLVEIYSVLFIILAC
jgi:hypothetical protein